MGLAGARGDQMPMVRCMLLAAFMCVVDAFAPPSMLRTHTPTQQLVARTPSSAKMMGEVTALEQVSTTLAGVVAVDGGTIGLEVSFAAFLAVILGLFIPVVFLVTLFIQSEAQGTARSFRQPDNPYTKQVGILYEDE